jgi:predicted metal-binding membrane protein
MHGTGTAGRHDVERREVLVERLIRRDSVVVVLCLAAAIALSFAYLVKGPSLGGMENMSGMTGMPAPMATNWSSFAWLAPMWVAMMIGMMLPSATPMLLLFARLQRISYPAATPMGATLGFAAGYLLVWIGFSFAAALLQSALSEQAWLSQDMRLQSTVAQAALLGAAGIFELTPLKSMCLDACRSPARFLADHGHASAFGPLRTGAEHGLFCLGCCAILMWLLFVGGVMSPLAIGGLTIAILTQKLAPPAWHLDRVFGAALIGMCAALLLRG